MGAYSRGAYSEVGAYSRGLIRRWELIQGGLFGGGCLFKGAYSEVGAYSRGLIRRWELIQGGLFGGGYLFKEAYSEVGVYSRIYGIVLNYHFLNFVQTFSKHQFFLQVLQGIPTREILLPLFSGKPFNADTKRRVYSPPRE